MFDRAERYGHQFVKLADSRATEKEFEFDQMLLMPTAKGRLAPVENLNPWICPMKMKLLSKCSKLCCGERSLTTNAIN
jgi:hypothetical protein